MLAFILVFCNRRFYNASSMIVPPQAVSLVSVVLFLVFGIYMILTRGKEGCLEKTIL
ncbi:MAG: hypothetical protein HA496_08170 [Thaumarchaeota archaeon]|nr:hypothetical protein [Nitrososphaerota archaeon]